MKNPKQKLKKAHEIIADLLICFDDGVGEEWNKKQLKAAREFVDETTYRQRAAIAPPAGEV